MKFKFLLGTFAIAILGNACGMHADPGLAHDGGEGATGGTTGDGAANAAGTKSAGAGNAAGSKSDGSGNAAGSTSDGTGAGGSKSGGHAGTGGTQSNGDGATGGTKGDGAGHSGGSKSDGNGDAGFKSDGDGEAGAKSDGDGDAAGANGDGDGEAGSGAVSSSGGSGGLAGGAGAGGLSSAEGSGGVSGSGGSAGLSGGAGSAGTSASGGSGDTSASGGSGGTSASGGSGGLSSSGGSAGVSASGGSGGLSSSGGSAGASGSAGSGGSAGDSDGRYLYTTETFGGNGRTCTTCHTAETGTISPDQVQAVLATDPGDPLFRPLDSDDGVGTDYTELEDHATFRVSIALPPGVFLTSDPSATSVVFRRGVPTTINTPALDSVLMWDGRAASLMDQALGAITGHAQATVTPTSDELGLIAAFEQSDDFFSSDLLRQYSEGGPEPTWPPGVTDSEQRGRRWFAQDSAAPRFNICGQCHGGPMANTTQSNSGLPVGKRFQTVNVSEFNHLGNPTHEFSFPDPTHPGQTVKVTTPDPGRALITGDVRDVNFFKIPPLWGVKNTAPYFHDNSAATLEELADHYEQHLATFLPSNATYPRPHVPTAQDKADIVAYLKLL